MVMKRRRSPPSQDGKERKTSLSKKRRFTQNEGLDSSLSPREHQDTSEPSGSSSSNEDDDSPPANPAQDLTRQVQIAVKQHDKAHPIEIDIRDTLRQLTYQQSQELSKSLVQWGRKGGLREKRQTSRPSTRSDLSSRKIYDPTASSFTLWPLPICPKPDWTLEEELSSLVSVEKRKFNDNDEGSLSDDSESGNSPTSTLVSHNRTLLQQLFQDLYEFHPPSSSSLPIFTSRRKQNYEPVSTSKEPMVVDGNIPDLHKNTTDPDHLLNPDQMSPSTNQNDLVDFDYGLGWRFILQVADTNINIKKNVLQRTCDRLLEMFRISPESSDGDQNSLLLQPLYLSHLKLHQALQRHRQI